MATANLKAVDAKSVSPKPQDQGSKQQAKKKQAEGKSPTTNPTSNQTSKSEDKKKKKVRFSDPKQTTGSKKKVYTGCWKCGAADHHDRDVCPKKDVDGVPFRFYAGYVNGRRILMVSIEVNGHRLVAGLDSCCDAAIVRRSAVESIKNASNDIKVRPSDQGPIVIKGIGGSSSAFPLKLKVGGRITNSFVQRIHIGTRGVECKLDFVEHW